MNNSIYLLRGNFKLTENNILTASKAIFIYSQNKYYFHKYLFDHEHYIILNMRRSIQNLGLDSLPASFLSDSTCKGYGAIGCLKKPDNGYHFLSGVSIYNALDAHIHLSFGDKFDSVVFLYALYEEGAAAPTQLLCLDHSIFMQYAFSDATQQSIVAPHSNEWVRFNTDEFLEQNKGTNQETVIEDITGFKKAASRLVNYLVGKKNDAEFDEIFCPKSVEANDLHSMQEHNSELDGTIIITADPPSDMNVSIQNTGSTRNKKRDSKKKKKDIDWAYNNHATPRKRSATVFYEPEIPKQQKQVVIDMNELEEEERQLEAGKQSKKSSKKNAKKNAKPAKTAKEKSPKTPAPKTPTPKTPTPKTSSHKYSGSFSTPAAGPDFVTNVTVQQQQAQVLTQTRNKGDEREEREYLRRQSILDLEVETKKTSSYFDLAERANRMA